MTASDDITVDVASIHNDDHIPLGEIHYRSWQEGFRGIMSQATLDEMSIEEEQGNFKRMLTRLEIDARGEGCLAARINGRPIGLVWYGPSRSLDTAPRTAQILALFIDPEYWRVGAGRALLNEARDRLAAQGYDGLILWVIERNDRARRFYEGQGFTWDETNQADRKGGDVRYRGSCIRG